MGISHHIQDDIAEFTVVGRFSADDLCAGFEQMLSNPALPLASHILINVTASEEIPPTAVIKRIAKILGRNRSRLSGRVAVWVSHKIRYGMARQLGGYLSPEGISAHPFYDRQEAVDWLRGVIPE